MGDVVNLKQSQPRMWVCGCGCRSFTLLEDGTAECTNCDKVVCCGKWHVVNAVESEVESPPFRQNIVDSLTPHIVLNDALKRIWEVAVLAVIYEGATEFRVWDRPMTDDEQKALPAAIETITNKIKRRL